MKISVNIPDYPSESRITRNGVTIIGGLEIEQEEGLKIYTMIQDDALAFVANKAGLRSLANACLGLAQEGIPEWCHIHMEEYNGWLEEGSESIIIDRSNNF